MRSIPRLPLPAPHRTWLQVFLALLWLAAPQLASASSLSEFVLYGVSRTEIGASVIIDDGAIGSTKSVLAGRGVTMEGVRAGTTIDLEAAISRVGGLIANGAISLATSSLVFGDINGSQIGLDGSSFLDGNAIAAGGINTAPGAVITGSQDPFGNPNGFTPLTLPGLTSFSAGGNDVRTAAGQVTNLAPGSYGIMELGAANTLQLTAGEYFFKSIDMGSLLTLNYDVSGGDISIFVEGNVRIGSSLMTNLIGGGAEKILMETHGDYRLGSSGTWFGTVIAERDIWLQTAVDFTGAGYAHKAVRVDPDGQIAFAPSAQIVPEPRTWALLLVATLALAARRRSLASTPRSR